MDKYPQMIYRVGGHHELHGFIYRFKIASADSDEDLAAAKQAGWHETTTAAVEAHEAEVAAAAQAAANLPPTRAELELKATQLGIAFKASTSDEALLKSISAKLAA
jgi:hypothetical protein